jgi:hypothetical protein
VDGCFKGLFRLGCLVAIVVAALALWWFRDPIGRKAAHWFGRQSTALPPVADTSVGAPTPTALASAEAKLQALGQRGGPDSVLLNAKEVASLIGRGIDWSVRKAFDSLRVELLDGKLAVDTRLDTRVIPPSELGPFQGMLAPREPLRMVGTLTIARPGVARWTVTELSLRGFPFPAPAVRAMTRRMAGADSSGGVAVRLAPAVARIVVGPVGVILYRRAAR